MKVNKKPCAQLSYASIPSPTGSESMSRFRRALSLSIMLSNIKISSLVNKIFGLTFIFFFFLFFIF